MQLTGVQSGSDKQDQFTESCEESEEENCRKRENC